MTSLSLLLSLLGGTTVNDCRANAALEAVHVAVDSMSNPHQVLLKQGRVWIDAGYLFRNLDSDVEEQQDILSRLSRAPEPFKTGGIEGQPLPTDADGAFVILRIGNVRCSRTEASGRVSIHLKHENQDRPWLEDFYVTFERRNDTFVLTSWGKSQIVG